MVKILCKLCMQYTSASQWKSHTLQKQHLQNLPTKIIVTGSFPDESHAIYDYLSEFGGIRREDVTIPGTEIEYRFWDPRIHCDVIHQEHALFEKELQVSWVSKSGCTYRNDSTMKNEMYTYRKLKIIKQLKKLPFQEQLNQFEKDLSVEATHFKERQQEIRSVLSESLSITPSSKIQFFGSSITELITPQSNFNVYLSNATLENIKDLLLKSELFENVGIIDSVLKCTFKKYNTSCFITTGSELPIGTSELLKFYISLNDKLKLFFQIIKFWAECNDFNTEVSNYTFYLLIVFFLQQEPFNLPSVKQLQKDATPDLIQGWNCAFSPVEFSTKVLEEKSIEELVFDFFKFYGDFDYFNFVVCPFLGIAIEKIKFLKPYDLPEDFLKGKEEMSIDFARFCIQDPFEHCNNVGRNWVGCWRFPELCRNCIEPDLYKLFIFESCSYMSVRKNDVWLDEEFTTFIKNILQELLEDVLACTVEIRPSEEGYSLICTSEYNIWEDRIKLFKDLLLRQSVCPNTLESEEATTAFIRKWGCKVPPTTFILNVNFESDPTAVKISERGAVPGHVLNFLYVAIKKFMKKDLIVNRNDDLEEDDVLFNSVEDVVMDEVKVDNSTQNLEVMDLTEDDDIIVEIDEEINVLVEGEFERDQLPQLHAYLIQYGKILKHELRTNEPHRTTVLFTFDLKSFDTALFERDHEFKTKLLTVTTQDHRHNEIIKNLKTDTFNNQLTQLFDKLRVNTLLDKVKINELLTDLKRMLPNREIVIFGPILRDVGYISGYFDLYIEKITSGYFTMFKTSGKFDQIWHCDGYLHMRHCSTNITCKLQLCFAESVKIIALIDYYMLFNKHLLRLVNFLEFWLLHTGAITNSLDFNRTLCVMVIFFLQRKYGVPSVYSLQAQCAPLMLGPWNFAFFRASFKNPNLQNVGFFDLLVDFFKFYSTFDYTTKVIAPFYGCEIEKNDFLEWNDVPDCYELYKTNKVQFVVKAPLCVQHPFMHSFNMADKMAAIQVGTFCTLCDHATKVIKQPENKILGELFDKTQALKRNILIEYGTDRNSFQEYFKNILKVAFKAKQLTETSNDNVFNIECTIGREICSSNQIVTSGDINLGFSEYTVVMYPKRVNFELLFFQNTCNVEIKVQNVDDLDLLSFIYFRSEKYLPYWSCKQDDIIIIDEETADLITDVSVFISLEKCVQRLIVTDLLEALKVRYPIVQAVPYLSSRAYSIYLNLHETEANGINNLLNHCEKFNSAVINDQTEFSVKCKHVSNKEVFWYLNLGKMEPLKINELITKYLSLDSKIEMLFDLVYAWLTKWKINFSSAGMALLMIFFLQTRYKFPAINTLNVSTLKSEESLWKLLSNFLDFLTNFDFLSFIVCPNNGLSLPKTKLFKSVIYTNEILDFSFVVQNPIKNDDFFMVLHNKGMWQFFWSCYQLQNFFDLENPATCLKSIGAIPVSNHDFVIKRQGDNFRDNVIQTISMILQEVCGGTTISKKMIEGKIHLHSSVNPLNFTYRFYAKKTLLVSEEVSVLEKESLISSTTQMCFPMESQKWLVQVMLVFDKDQVTIQIVVPKKNTKRLAFHIKQFTVFLLTRTLQEKRRRKGQDEFSLRIVRSIPESYSLDRQLDMILHKISEAERLIEKFVPTISQELTYVWASDKIKTFYFNWKVVGGRPEISINHQVNTDSNLEQASALLSGDKFQDICILPDKVRFKHTQSQIMCYIDTDSNLQTKQMLLEYYLNHQKVAQLVNLVKFWADYHQLTQSFGFTTTSLYSIVVFFLQQEPYNLPPIYKMNGKFYARLVGHKIEELLLAFFKFYSTFDYFLFVISPFVGIALEKRKFLKREGLPPQLENYSKGLDTEFFCVQDPFDHTRNLCTSVLPYISGRFVSLCKASVERVSKTPNLESLLHSNCPKFEIFVEKSLKDFTNLQKFCKEIFVKVFHCQIKVISDISWQCTGLYDIWSKRSEASRNIDLENDLTKQSAITDIVIQKYPQRYVWGLFVEFKDLGEKISISLSDDLSSHGFIFQCYNFLYFWLQPYVNQPPSISQKTQNSKNLELIKNDLQNHLSRTGIHFFGSRMINVETKNSDLNIFINKSDLPKSSDHLEQIKTILTNSGLFDNFTITRNPFLKNSVLNCDHKSTKMKCEFSVESITVVRNSELLRNYFALDRRIRNLTRFFQYTLRTHKILNRVSNYGLNLLVLFFLQQEPLKLPPVSKMQELIPQHILEGWNCSSMKLRITINSDITELQLQKAIFKFYGDFDFFSFVISPFYGDVIMKSRFLEPVDVPSCYKLFLQQKEKLYLRPFCLQDPFEHNKNVSSFVTMNCVSKFSAFCRSALRNLEEKGNLDGFNVTESSFRCTIRKPEHFSENQCRELLVKVLLKVLYCNVRQESVNSYKCEGQFAIASNRANVFKELGLKELHLEDEIKISSKIAKTKPKLPWTIHIDLHFKKSPNQICLTIKGSNYTSCLVHFLHTRFSRFILEKNGIEKEQVIETSIQNSVDNRLPESVIEAPFKILVKGLDNPEEYFSKFGKIISSEKDIVEFQEVKSYLKALHLVNSKFKIFPLAPITGKLPNGSFQDFTLAVVNDVLVFKTIQEQVTNLCRKIKEKEKSIKDAVTNDLSQLFSSTNIQLLTILENNAVNVYYFDTSCKTERDFIVEQLCCDNRFFGVVSAGMISCKHFATQKECRLHKKDKTIVNWQLVNYYCRISKKIDELLTFLLFWASTYDLLGEMRFSEDAFSSLVIFFLQQEPYKLPTVHDLQENTIPDLEDGWNVAFTEFLEFTSCAVEGATSFDLIQAFLEFYGDFNYLEKCVCPFSGEATNKMKFSTKGDLPKCYRLYTERSEVLEVGTGFCVQDFFKHSVNKTINCSKEFSGYFTSFCRFSLDVTKGDGGFILYKFLLQCHLQTPGFLVEKLDRKTILDVVSNHLKLEISQMSESAETYKCVLQNRETHETFPLTLTYKDGIFVEVNTFHYSHLLYVNLKRKLEEICSAKRQHPSEDDIPEDFFDDFTKDDFLEGFNLSRSEETPGTSHKRENDGGIESQQQKKIKLVIEPPSEKQLLLDRCKQVIDVLSGVVKLKKCSRPPIKNNTTIKYRSPLKTSMVSFSFTARSRYRQVSDGFSSALDHLITRTCISRNNDDAVDLVEGLCSALVESKAVNKDDVVQVMRHL